MVSGLGMTTTKWEQLQTEYLNQNSPVRRNYSNNTTGLTTSNNNQTDTFVSSKDNTCTDGADDGKIGLFSAVGNIVEGAGKSVVNAVKGAFTDSNGNFSITKTLTTVGMSALCIAVPAVGVALAGVGLATGGTKFVTGVATALNAETDAEAKDAWEQVGEGALTVGLSATGAKASMKAVQNSSSVGALTSFKQGSSFTQNPLGYVKALGQDMLSSTKNSIGKIKTSATTLYEGARLYKMRKAVTSQKGALTAEELSQQNKLNALEAFSPDKVKTVADNMANLKSNIKNTATQFGTHVKSAINPSNIRANITNLLQKKGGQGLLTTLKTNIKNNGSIVQNVLSKLSSTQKTIYSALTKEGASYNTLVQKYGYDNVIGVLEVLGSYRLLDENI